MRFYITVFKFSDSIDLGPFIDISMVGERGIDILSQISDRIWTICNWNHLWRVLHKKGEPRGWVRVLLTGRSISNLMYADDTTLLATTKKICQDCFDPPAERFFNEVGLKINIPKCSLMQPNRPLSYHFRTKGVKEEKEVLI